MGRHGKEGHGKDVNFTSESGGDRPLNTIDSHQRWPATGCICMYIQGV